MRPRLLDLFSGAGGATCGYQRAGFEVIGVDINPQPNYCGDGFIQGDALEVLADPRIRFEFDAIHASPPCQAFSAGKNMWAGRLAHNRHPDLVGPVRDLLRATRIPYVIENVEGAPLRDYITLCGDMFGLAVKRHRLFETSFFIWAPPTCRSGHPLMTVSVFGGGALSRTPVGGTGPKTGPDRGPFMQRRTHVPIRDAEAAMGIDWMTRSELSQAIPPPYTEFIGHQLLAHVEAAA